MAKFTSETQWNTGRQYTSQGQCIVAKVLDGADNKDAAKALHAKRDARPQADDEMRNGVHVAYDRCHDCGSDMLPDAFPTHPALPDFAGYPAGAVVDGEVWVRCTHGCRGGWRPARVRAWAGSLDAGPQPDRAQDRLRSEAEEHQMTSAQFAAKIAEDRAASFTLQRMIATATERDVLDALIDAEALATFCRLRAREAGIQIEHTETEV